ncbi:MAG TPA: glycosyltransferase [Streptosporangiaceae bacterium]|nr:glycosyltransferase [Streptosporangiaceae bacterium]
MSLTTAGRHRYRTVIQAPPDNREKFLYISRSLPYLAVSLTLAFLAAFTSQVFYEINTGIWIFAIFTLIGTIAFSMSMPLGFAGQGFSIERHQELVRSWRPRRYPDVDIFLPCCGEPIEVLRNTWTAVAEMVQAYQGRAMAFVLDDGADSECESEAASLGHTYVVRPNRGRDKKSGNLRYAFAHTRGEFFIVLDADFAPRRDFLAETLPYFDDPAVAIVQTPQYFRTDKHQTWVESAAGAIQELFYRAIQVGRDRLGASICVGTCALYRRYPLLPQGGTTLIAYAEDVHTGLDVRRAGWKLVYVPVILATGMCPTGLNAFIRQQYRWCTGSTSTVLTSRLWTVPMSIPARLTYISGFCYYVFTGLSVFVIPLIPISLLLFKPYSITPLNSGLIVVSMLTSMTVMPLWHHASYDLRQVLPLTLVRSWAHALAIWDYVRGKTMQWQATGTRVSPVSRFWWGIRLWSLTAVMAWLALIGWRMTAIPPGRFTIITISGFINLAVVLRVVFPGKRAA